MRNPGFRSLGGLTAILWSVLAAAPAAGQVPASPTFTKDIAPVLQRSCQSCHRPGANGPMSLMTYEEVRPWASAIKRRTAAWASSRA